MKIICAFFVWCLIFVLCWPIAILALIAAPIIWLLALPFYLLGFAVHGVFAFVRALFLLPARLIGGRNFA